MITLKDLESLERTEYDTLRDLQAIADDARREGRPLTQSLRYNIEWQRGRWSMISDLLEKLSK